MRRQFIHHLHTFIVGMLLLACLSCSKEHVIQEPDIAVQVSVVNRETGSTSLTLSYRIDMSIHIHATGIVVAEDSLSLASNPDDYEKIAAVKASDQYQVQFSEGKPNKKYWYRIYVGMDGGQVEYSKTLSFYTSGIPFAIMPPHDHQDQVFYRTCEGDSHCGDLTIRIDGLSAVDASQFRVFYNQQPCVLNIIEHGETAMLHISLPHGMASGKYPFSMHYQGEEIYFRELHLLHGRFNYLTSHPLGRATGYHYVYNGLLHSTFYYLFDHELSIWNPTTNQWHTSALSRPIVNWVKYEITGKEIDGMIYFNPFCIRQSDADYTNFQYFEYIDVLNPRTYEMELVALWETQNPKSQYYHLETLDTYAYDGVLYCLLKEYKELGDFYEYRIRSYNPKTRDWTLFCDLSLNDYLEGGRIVVHGQKLYFFAEEHYPPIMGVGEVDNYLYEIDLQTQAMNRLATNARLLGTGSIGAYFFEHDGSLFIFGGRNRAVFFEYNIEGNTWKESALSYGNFPPSLGFHSGFCVAINGNVYTGFGYNPSNSHIFQLDLEQ